MICQMTPASGRAAFNIDFPLAGSEPLASGTIRTCADDFVVEESLGFEPCGHGEHVYLNVEKVGANTAFVAAALARFSGVRPFDVSYAGKKDRHARTRQWFSCWLPGKVDMDWIDHGIDGVRILAVTRHNKKLRRGGHQGNLFKVLVRPGPAGFSAADRGDMMARLADIGRDGFPNYFGEQRFGHDGNNLVNADRLLNGKRFKRNEKEIYLSAARSYLFNCQLAAAIERGDWRESQGWLPGMTRKDEFEACDEPGFEAWYEGFRKFGVKAMMRPLSVTPSDLKGEFNDDNFLVTFKLPRGSYATSLLREVVAYNTHSGHREQALG